VLTGALRLGLAVGLVALTACSERAADVDHPRTFDEGGLAFSYPGNWKVEVTRHDRVRTINVESPGNAIITMIEAQPAIAMDAAHYAKVMTDSMQKAVAGKTGGVVEISVPPPAPATRTLFGAKTRGLRYHFTLTALGQPVPHGADAWAANLPDRSLFVWAQAADDDVAKVAAGLEQVVGSLRLSKP
jgi:hypothetical protein